MVYFNINQVEKERYYGNIHIRKRKDTMKEKRYDERKDTTRMIRTRKKKDARMKNGTHQFT